MSHALLLSRKAVPAGGQMARVQAERGPALGAVKAAREWHLSRVGQGVTRLASPATSDLLSALAGR